MNFSATLIFNLMLWISTTTGYVIPDPPNIGYKTGPELTHMLYGCEKPNEYTKEICEKVERGETRTERTLAIYNHDTQTIYMLKGLGELYDKTIVRSVLLHELIHHLQYQNNVNFRCLGKYEKEAYALQDNWLEEQGYAPVTEVLDLNPLYLMMIFQCGEDLYYQGLD